MESLLHVNMEYVIGGEGRTYPYHRQKNTDGTKNSLGRCYARDLLCQVHGLDGHVQCREDTIPTFLHGRESKWLRGTVMQAGFEKKPEP